jgi:glycosyltransferase involved in cell wall biosynthesis
MKISVVIPAHNRPDLLLEAIGSIVAQTHLNWEVVIVDDGSSPAIPLDQLKSHLGGNAIFLRHDKSRGVACAKNAGIKAATGEIITLLDDDDLLSPSALARIDEAFTSRPDLDCLFLGVEPFGPYATNPAESRKKAIDKIIQRVCPTESNGLYLFDNNLFSELLYSVPIDWIRTGRKHGRN